MSTLTVAPVCVIEAVAAPEKEKTKLGETSMAGWLFAHISVCILLEPYIARIGQENHNSIY